MAFRKKTRLIVASVAYFLLLCLWHVDSQATNVREGLRRRNLQSENAPYYHNLTTWTLGRPNPDAAIGNPLKGLVESPIYTWPPYTADIPLALEFYYVGLDEVMFGNPNIVGEQAFNWTVMDNYLSGSASRNMHAVWRVILDFPGYEFKVPQYLIEAGINTISYDGGVSLDYGDPLLLEAMEQLITRLGKRYDGDKRLGFLQVGLLGFWGEWHTWGVDDAIPPGSQERVTGWFANSFSKTQIQTRYAVTTGYEAGFGRHDDSFAYNTLDGPSNGGVEHEWYFWPNVIELNQSDFWHRGATGGETSVQLQIEVFDPGYPARTYEKQDFMECVRAVHATYMFHHAAFKDGGFSGLELTNARRAHARMGYNFHVPLVSVKASSTPSTVDVDVTVRQIGVAPFYYDLLLAIQCSGMKKKSVPGVSKLTSNGESRVFEFTGLPATTDCLNRLALTLESSYIYEDRPIKFAQGNGTVVFRLPLPPTVIDYPETSPLSTNSVPSRAPSATSIAAKPRMVPSQNPAVATSPRIAPVGQIPIKKLTWPPFVGFPSNPV